MKYQVSISYFDFVFDSLNDATTFAAMAVRSQQYEEKPKSISIEFINDEKENTPNEEDN